MILQNSKKNLTIYLINHLTEKTKTFQIQVQVNQKPVLIKKIKKILMKKKKTKNTY